MVKKFFLETRIESITIKIFSILFLPVLMLSSCSSARSSYLKDTILDYYSRGFLSKNLFQVHCDTRLVGVKKPEVETRSRSLGGSGFPATL